MNTITVAPTRITDIDATIARLKMAARFMDDRTTTGMMTDRIADLVIERQHILDMKVSKTVAKPSAPKANKPAPKPVKPVASKPAKPAKKASKPALKAPIAPEAGIHADPSIAAGSAKPVAKTALNWNGTPMLSGRGTASDGQKRWMKANGVKPNVIAIISMVGASNLRAERTGKLA